MKNSTRTFFGLTLAAAANVVFNAYSADLNVGDMAPKLASGKFVQGDAVTEFSPDKAYIVEFWATWCGPCRASIPHLNEVYKKFKDKGLVVIGQDCWEQDESKVAPFLKEMGEKMTYRVALDDKEGSKKGKMAETWMEAAGQNGIPSAFLVDKTGHVAWIGHPMTIDEKVIDQVLAGNYDLKVAAEKFKKDKGDEDKVQSLSMKFSKDMKGKNWDAASADCDELEKLRPDLALGLKMTRFQILNGKKDFTAADAILRDLAEASKNDPNQQNQLAWMLVTDKNIEHPNLELAETMAQRAVDGAKDAELKWGAMDTLARVKFMKGSKEDAIKIEQQALDAAPEDQKAGVKKTLESYKSGALPAAQ